MERLQAEQEKGCEIKYLNMGEKEFHYMKFMHVFFW